jgi:hypothetical protein
MMSHLAGAKPKTPVKTSSTTEIVIGVWSAGQERKKRKSPKLNFDERDNLTREKVSKRDKFHAI